MTVTHVGSNTQYASNWESIFTKRAKKKGSPAPKKPAPASAKKKSGKKKSGKK